MENVYSVSDITREIKEMLEMELPPVWVQGEISNFVHHASGHMYFSLKDENAQLACVMWRSRNALLPFRPQDGKMVNVFGRITVYEKRGSYQLDVQKMAPLGLGDLQQAFEELKARLAAEGLFDEAVKKPLPQFPQRIGIITSQSGAAIRDIVTVLNNRLPGVEKILRPALVQGDGAAQDIAEAIRDFNLFKQVDVIILGRGGGSLEDLWAFNEEIVARAIFASDIPIVSAVGHQIDFTISDFVADARAATPSAAAEMVVKDHHELQQTVDRLTDRCVGALMHFVEMKRERLVQLSSGYAFRRPLDRVLQNRQRIDDLAQTILSLCRRNVNLAGERLANQRQRIAALHPQSILKRGYSVVQDKKTGKVVRQAEQLAKGDELRLYFANGAADSHVDDVDVDGNISQLI